MATHHQFCALIFFFCLSLHGKAQFSDAFSDGNFSMSPTWSGSDSLFLVNAAGQLQSNGSANAGTAWLSTPCNLSLDDTATWEFFWKMAFAPSGNNASRVYLASSQQDLKLSLNGYCLHIGESGSGDALKFYRQDGAASVLLASGTTSFGTAPELRVKVERWPDGTWLVQTDSTGGNSFVPEISATDTTYSTTGFFGILCKYTSSNSAGFFFDDFVVAGTPFTDTIAPEIASVEAVNEDEVNVFFNEPIGPASIQAGNFTLGNGMGAAVSATLDAQAPWAVHLVLSQVLQKNATCELLVSEISDTAGNMASALKATFSYYVPEEAIEGEVVFNEILADPSPAVGLPEAEFIELFNASDKAFELAGWVLSDPSTEAQLPSLLLPPHAYLLLCNAEDIHLFGGIENLVGLENWPSLNNSGDFIKLSDPAGNVIDRIAYHSNWFLDSDKKAGGYSLERINPFFRTCADAENWRGSTAGPGGTPSAQNAVFNPLPDTIPPRIAQVLVQSTGKIRITFSESADSSALFSAGIEIDGTSVGIASLDTAAFSFAEVVPGQSLDSSALHTLAISGVHDCAGLALEPNFETFVIGVPPRKYDVVINEFSPKPDASLTGLPEAEFVELYNRSGDFIRLEGARISDASGASGFETVVMPPEGYLLVCDEADAGLFAPFGPIATVPTFPSLNNSSDRIALEVDSTVIDEVFYESSWFRNDEKAEGGWSLERVNPDALCAGGSNWNASNNVVGGTPGKGNSVLDRAANLGHPTLMVLQAVEKDLVIATFDQPIVSGLGVGNVFVEPSSPIDSVVMQENGHSFALHLQENLSTGVAYAFSFDGLEDCTGNVFPAGPGHVSIPAPGAIKINEILFNPRGDGTDYVELYNASETPVNLAGWELGYFNNKDSLVGNTVVDSTYILYPGDYVALHENREDVLINYPGAVDSNLLETDLPTYGNSEGSVILLNPFRETEDYFDYLEDYHFPLIKNYDGVALERLDPQRPTQDVSNWNSASVDDNHGTPGYLNSQFLVGPGVENSIELAPEVFSPDNDGRDDVLTISYAFEQAGFVATIRIYDSKGFPVKTVVNNALLGAEGTFSWNGINDDHEKASVGIHVVHVEIFDLDGNVHHFKKPCVLATRF